MSRALVTACWLLALGSGAWGCGGPGAAGGGVGSSQGAKEDVTVVRRHLKRELSAALRERFGTELTLEQGCSDMKLRRGALVELIEVKKNRNASAAIREALGELLADSSRCLSPDETLVRFVVAAPSELTQDDRKLLRHLREELRTPLDYLWLRHGFRAAEYPDLPAPAEGSPVGQARPPTP